MMGPPIMDSTFYILWLLSVLAAAMAFTTFPAASTTVLAIAYIIVSSSVAILISVLCA